MSARGAGERVSRLIWQSFATTEGAVLLGAAGVTALATATPWFLALGAAGCGILAYERLGELRKERAGARYRLTLPALEGWGDAARQLAQEGHRAAQAVLSEIATAPDFTRDLFATAAAEVRNLYDKYLLLVSRLDEITRYLATLDAGRLGREREQMRKRAQAADDDAEREQYQSALNWLEESLASRRDLERDAGRIVARLAGIRAALDSAGAKVVHVKSAEARNAAGEGQEVAHALSALGNEITSLSEAVDEVFVRSREASRRRQDATAGEVE
jgi:hypothetical protein